MPKPLIDDNLWRLLQPLFPPHKERNFRFPGRLRLSDRAVLSGVILALKTGLHWSDIPAELGWGCGKVCRERFCEWRRTGIWDSIHKILVINLRGGDKLDWERIKAETRKARTLDAKNHTLTPHGERVRRPVINPVGKNADHTPRNTRSNEQHTFDALPLLGPLDEASQGFESSSGTIQRIGKDGSDGESCASAENRPCVSDGSHTTARARHEFLLHRPQKRFNHHLASHSRKRAKGKVYRSEEANSNGPIIERP